MASAKTLAKGSRRHRVETGISHIKDLRPDPANRRAHNPRNLGMVVDALHAVGAARSIVIDEDNVVLAGNGVTEAAAEAGITKVQVVDVDGSTLVAVRRIGLSAEQKRALAIFDNRTAELAEWNAEQLQADLDAGLSLQPWFSEEEAAALLAKQSQAKDGLTDPDAVPEERPTGIVAGDLFELGRHRLLCGDSTVAGDVARLMDGQRANSVVTDPPYGQDQPGVTNDESWRLDETISGAVANLPITDAVVVAFGSPRTFPVWLDDVRARGHKFERLLWLYKAAQNTYPWRGWLLKSEAIVVSTLGAGQWQDVHPYSHDCYYLSEVSGELPEGTGWHGSVKPMVVVLDIVRRVCPIGGIVFEPFSGSGTTLMASQQGGMFCRAIDIDPKNIQVSIDRWEQFTGQKAQKVGEAVSV